jgi:hypothetical protein
MTEESSNGFHDVESNHLSYQNQRKATLADIGSHGATTSGKVNIPHRISISNIDINVDDIHRNLNTVNTFATKRLEKLQPILMYEITADGDSVYKNMTLRDLLYLVNSEADEIDEEYFDKWANINNNTPPPPPPANPSPVKRSSIANIFGAVEEPQHEQQQPPLETTESDRDGRSVSEYISNTHPFDPPQQLQQQPTPPQLSPRDDHRSDSPHTIERKSAPGNNNVNKPARRPTATTAQRTTADVNHAITNHRSFYGNVAPHPHAGLSHEHSPLYEGPGAENNNYYTNNPNYNNNNLPEEETYDAVNILRLRDLRRLDTSSNPNEEKSILIRRHAVLFAMVKTPVFFFSNSLFSSFFLFF